jgi:hypothetical protein
MSKAPSGSESVKASTAPLAPCAPHASRRTPAVPRPNPQVVVRCRPLNSKEKQDGRDRIVDMDTDAGQVKVRHGFRVLVAAGPAANAFCALVAGPQPEGGLQ